MSSEPTEETHLRNLDTTSKETSSRLLMFQDSSTLTLSKTLSELLHQIQSFSQERETPLETREFLILLTPSLQRKPSLSRNSKLKPITRRRLPSRTEESPRKERLDMLLLFRRLENSGQPKLNLKILLPRNGMTTLLLQN